MTVGYDETARKPVVERNTVEERDLPAEPRTVTVVDK
jgi:hypothetical protein